MMTMFFCRETLLRLHNYRSKCGTWNIFWIFFSYFGECKCIFAELSGANNNYIRKEGGKHIDPFERKHTRFWNASRKNNLYCSHVLSSSNPKITVFPRNKKKKEIAFRHRSFPKNIRSKRNFKSLALNHSVIVVCFLIF